MSILGRLNYRLDKEHLRSIARVICSEALFAMDNLFPDAICDNIYIRFPEPWSSKSNFHKRIINHKMGMLLAWKLKRNGTLVVTTDDISFRDHTIQVLYEMRELWCHESTVTLEPNTNNIPELVNETASEDEELNVGGFENMLKERGCKFYHMTFRRV
jgi:tRNA G46 methylase TrmB